MSIQPGNDGHFSVALSGPVDMETVPELRKSLLRIALKKKCRSLAIDLSGVTRVDSAAVAMLVELAGPLARKGGVLRLSGVDDQSRRMIRLTRVEELFQLEGEDTGD